MAEQKDITLHPGAAAPADIVLRELPVADVVTTEIFLHQGAASGSDITLRSVPGTAESAGGDASITGAGGIASLEAFGSASVAAQISAAGIASAEAIGSAGVAAQVSTAGTTVNTLLPTNVDGTA